MHSIAWLLTGGFAKGYRTQILGLITALSALASWASATPRSPSWWPGRRSSSAVSVLRRSASR